jgi:hypothetical protein
MAGSNPTIVAQITAEDKTKAVLDKVQAGFRELNNMMKSLGRDRLPADMLNGLDREAERAARRIKSLKDDTDRARQSAHGLGAAFHEALKNVRPLAEIVAGIKIGHFGVETAKKAGEYAHAEIMNAYAGMTPAQVEHARKQTLDMQKALPGLSLTSGQHLAGSLYSVMADNHEAEMMFPELMKYRAALRAKHVSESEEQIDERTHNTLKFMEASGVTATAAAAKALLDKIQRIENFEQRMIDPGDLLGLSKQAGAYLKMLTDSGMKTAVQLVAEWGGERTGTFIQAVGKYGAGTGFDNHSSALVEAASMGLIDKRDLVLNKQGNPVSIRRGSASMARLGGLNADPLTYVERELVPSLDRAWSKMPAKDRARLEQEFAKQYGEQVKHNPDAAIRDKDGKAIDIHALDARQKFELNEIRRLFPNAVAARGLSEVFIQREQLRAKQGKIDQAEGVDQTLDTSKKDPAAQMLTFQQALSNFQTVLASPLMDTAADALRFMSEAIAGLTSELAKFQAEHPTVAKTLAGLSTAGAALAGGALATGALSSLINGFGLKESAVALTQSATALDAAAARLAGGAVPGGVVKGGAVAAAGAAEGGVLATLLGWGGKAASFAKNAGRLYGMVSTFGDLADMYDGWGKSTGKDKGYQGLATLGDIGLATGTLPGAAAKAVASFFQYVRENSEKWEKTHPNQPSEEDEARKEIERLNSLQRNGFTIGGAGLSIPPLAREPTFGDVPKYGDSRVPDRTGRAEAVTVSGSAEVVQHITVEPSPLLNAIVRRAEAITVPLSNKLGRIMDGENGVAPGPVTVPTIRSFR